jgi:GalNAc-alpha-(1->4)-GalNAc-alpha-(1->3)-diNAcBac-PP-undecaprenol alpha-1,4-N-acetyl-D-galactosaminyltransferase
LFDRSSPDLEVQNIFQAIIKRVLYPLSNGVIVQTKNAQEIVKKRKLNKKVYVLPNPLSEIKIKWVPNERKVITFVSRLVPLKNHKSLMRIFSEIDKKDWKLNIVGDGPLRTELENYAKKINIEEQVEFYGNRNDVFEILSNSTIFAFPSSREGFPNALLEALSMCVPCISNNCPTGPDELIRDGVNGYLVKYNDFEEFKKKLIMLMNDWELRDKFSLANYGLKEKYSIENITTTLITIIESYN